MLRETVYHTVYKNGEYSEEPSDVFLFYENEKDFIGFHCYFFNKYKEYENIVIIKDLEYSDIKFFKQIKFDDFKKDLISYIKNFNEKWNKKYSKVFVMNYFNIESEIMLKGEKYLVYDI
jgi:hypothetical protein